MHSRIFAISKDAKEADRFEVPECFVPTHADYYGEADDRKASIEWLTDFLKYYDVEFTLTGSVIVFHSVKAYLDTMYEQFMKAVKVLSETTPEQFRDHIISTYALDEANCDTTGFWFLIENEYCVTAQEFLRYVEPGVEYHIGKIYDYHI